MTQMTEKSKQKVLAVLSSYSQTEARSDCYEVAFKVDSPDQLALKIKNFLIKEASDSNLASAQEEVEGVIEGLKSEFHNPLPDVPVDEILQNLGNYGIASLLELKSIGKLYQIEYYTIDPLNEEWMDETDVIGICALPPGEPCGPYHLMNLEHLIHKGSLLDPADAGVEWNPNMRVQKSHLPDTLPSCSYLRFWEATMGPAFIVPVIDATK